MDKLNPLSISRLFKDSSLRPPLPVQARFSPAGDLVTFLAPEEVAGETDTTSGHQSPIPLALYRFNLLTKKTEPWVQAKDLNSLLKEDQPSSDANVDSETQAEQAERERRRQFATGILSYQWFPKDNRLLVPFAGAAFEISATASIPRRLTPPQTRQTDFQLSPQGTWLSYVRAGDLYILHLPSGEETRVTTDAGDQCANGIADFIAQEEMHRFQGHWWSPDEQILIYQKTDTSLIPETFRHEFGPDGLQVIPQRYPFAGAANAKIQLMWHELATGISRDLPWQSPQDEYLARVNWLDQQLFIQTQSRNQQRLRLKYFDSQSEEFQLAIEEQSDTWINLDNNFTAIDHSSFYWTAERGDTRQLYRVEKQSNQFIQHRLTTGAEHVNEIVKADAKNLWYVGWKKSPAEQHLFHLNIEALSDTQITQSAGWHEIEAAKDSPGFLDHWSNLEQPPTLDLIDGTGNCLHRLAGGSLLPSHPYYSRMTEHQTPNLGTLSAEDGQTLHYRLTKPSGSGPFPVIVNVYGGPGVQRVRNEWAGLESQLFVSRGIGILELDNRGSSNRGAAFEAPIYRLLGNVEVDDQAVGVEFLKTLSWVDNSRIGIFGHSYGGYMALMCLAKRPDLFAAGVSVAPVTNWKLYDTHYTERYLGTPQDNFDGYQNSSVFAHISGLNRPLLIMHGMADDNVLFDNSTELFLTLQQQDIEFSMMTYPGSKHALQEPHVAIHRYRCLLEFFSRHLSN